MSAADYTGQATGGRDAAAARTAAPTTAVTTEYDLITMGRSSIDLYSNDIGAPFEDITSFAAYVGGSPLNIAVGARRLGLRTALLTAVGADKVGDFIVSFLRAEGVETRYVPVKPTARSSAVVLGIEPPDRFPLVFYRDNAADAHLTIDDVLAAPIAASTALEVSGTGLAREPGRSATFRAAELARAAGRTVYLDLDFRADQWHDVRAYGVNVRALLPLVDVALGTVEEVNAAMLREAADVVITHQQVSAPSVRGDVAASIAALLSVPAGPEALVVKRGEKGATIHLRSGGSVDAPGFPVEVTNVLGAGDAFAAGFIYGRTKGWDWRRSARLGNACGAIVVTRHGCANFMATLDEAMAVADEQGGL
ncbi:MAG TPA: 5-dehydro-2-deoxygluconokinase [Trueperaceae bacterium]|nr:5-dehydro-2-deoxygluconokinase [Trueperaceae bacterium]